MGESVTASRILRRHRERKQRKEIESIDAFFGDLNPRERADIIEQLSYREKKLLQVAIVKRCGNCFFYGRFSSSVGLGINPMICWLISRPAQCDIRKVNRGWFACPLHQWRVK